MSTYMKWQQEFVKEMAGASPVNLLVRYGVEAALQSIGEDRSKHEWRRIYLFNKLESLLKKI